MLTTALRRMLQSYKQLFLQRHHSGQVQITRGETKRKIQIRNVFSCASQGLQTSPSTPEPATTIAPNPKRKPGTYGKGNGQMTTCCALWYSTKPELAGLRSGNLHKPRRRFRPGGPC